MSHKDMPMIVADVVFFKLAAWHEFSAAQSNYRPRLTRREPQDSVSPQRIEF